MNPKFFKRKSGVVRIVRDNYKKKTDFGQDNWWTIAARVRKRDGNKCVQCSGKEHLHVHHIRPLSKGGKTVDTNLITLCEDCHHGRHRHEF